MSFSRWVVRQRWGGREKRQQRERTRSGREEREVRENSGIARCSARTLDCRWRKMRAIVTTAVDTSPLIFPPAIYRFLLPFFPSSIRDAYCLTCMNTLSSSLEFFSLSVPFACYVDITSTGVSARFAHPSVCLILMISNRYKIIKNQGYVKVKINWHPYS